MRPTDVFTEYHFEVETRWPTSVATIEIRKRIATSPGPTQGDEPFFGRALNDTEFRFSRAHSGRDNLLPVIEATVTPTHPGGARVHVRMRLSDAMLGLTAVTIAGAALGLAELFSGGQTALALLGACALPVVGNRLHHGLFKREARRTEAILRAIFASAPALPPPHETGEPYR